ncbi:hypothetical protein EQP59_06350 [Ornithobacterium rhinotracheale]|uniref:Uncharacterized protein n=1 Tax=Ornithobacterium rhinotracheale TaxID=28251 RepID=A0A3R6AUQ4_ORNRH|nr:hypothetical protein [Ornithobacterium rhinotracheale]QAR30438.1 hypothetical protein EQP59_03255 [Ornithobacterium rhinotracheale]QAR30985.1 hypothetical protein EQP59_06350 [Ornithobacterium rhinotracheale]
MSDYCTIVIDNRRFRGEYVCEQASSVDLFMNCYYQVGNQLYTANGFKKYLVDKSDFVIYRRLIPVDGEAVKDLPTSTDEENSSLKYYLVGTYYDGFAVTKTRDRYRFANHSAKFVGVYLDVSDAYSHVVCELEPGQEYYYAGAGPFMLYDGDEEIRGIQ